MNDDHERSDSASRAHLHSLRTPITDGDGAVSAFPQKGAQTTYSTESCTRWKSVFQTTGAKPALPPNRNPERALSSGESICD